MAHPPRPVSHSPAWAMIAAFGIYFCTYAFRKPFSTGMYESVTPVFGISYKTVLLLTQVVGYMVSKFIGVRVISSLRPAHRWIWLLGLVSFAEMGLILFGWLPASWAWTTLFLAGLPLGMIWGLVFSYLEGRRLTEFLALGLSINMVMTSGILKSLYQSIRLHFPVSEFWMPALMGGLFFLPFLFFLWMLHRLPAPSTSDLTARKARTPMSIRHKQVAWSRYGVGLFLIILLYALLTTLRDFRDSFMIEIWTELSPQIPPSFYAQQEIQIAAWVFILLASIAWIRSNQQAFGWIHFLMLLSFGGMGWVTYAFTRGWISTDLWMCGVGIGLFLPYLIIQIAFFERLIALFDIRGNVGYFVYLCDSIGYFGSVALLFFKELWAPDLSWATLFLQYTHALAVIGGCLTLGQAFFFYQLLWKKKTILSATTQ